jgi:hypothetical protein
MEDELHVARYPSRSCDVRICSRIILSLWYGSNTTNLAQWNRIELAHLPAIYLGRVGLLYLWPPIVISSLSPLLVLLSLPYYLSHLHKSTLLWASIRWLGTGPLIEAGTPGLIRCRSGTKVASTRFSEVLAPRSGRAAFHRARGRRTALPTVLLRHSMQMRRWDGKRKIGPAAVGILWWQRTSIWLLSFRSFFSGPRILLSIFLFKIAVLHSFMEQSEHVDA